MKIRMTPKQEADKLIEQFYKVPNMVYSLIKEPIRKEIARQNAIKSVENILKTLSYYVTESKNDVLEHYNKTLEILEQSNKDVKDIIDYKDVALTTMNLLSNAAGCEFEDYDVALDIIINTLKKS